MLFADVNLHPERIEFEVCDAVVCPKCQGKLARHLVWNQENFRVFTYHCQEHGDVVPAVRD